MRKIVVSEFVTLDGVMQDPGGVGEIEGGGWNIPYVDEEFGKYKFDELSASEALLLGRVTYQGFAAAWPEASHTETEGEYANMMNSYPKYVVSTTLKQVEWNNSHLIKTDVIEEVSKLKQQSGKDILIFGSGELIQTLMQHDLIDEYRLQVHPLVLGNGKRLFKDGNSTKLKLVETKPFPSGVILLVYQPDRHKKNDI
ncbi:MAG TPA: dihydrofolate reductase family protein [Anaerolineales bacterium]|nr:dihydrofolate reductase family protein [Anaerolineales bacterium]